MPLLPLTLFCICTRIAIIIGVLNAIQFLWALLLAIQKASFESQIIQLQREFSYVGGAVLALLLLLLYYAFSQLLVYYIIEQHCVPMAFISLFKSRPTLDDDDVGDSTTQNYGPHSWEAAEGNCIPIKAGLVSGHPGRTMLPSVVEWELPKNQEFMAVLL